MNTADEKEIIRRFGTPSYVFDLDLLADRVQKIRDGLKGRAKICYAMKANSFLVGPLKGLVDSFEVCSPGEFRICERLGVPMRQVVLSGVYKSETDVCRVIETYGGEGVYTIESFSHLRFISDAAAGLGQRVKTLIRVTSGNQFGMDEADICDLISRREEYPFVDFIGLQLYSGTQKKKPALFEQELQRLDDLCDTLWERFGFTVRQLEYGPGFFVPYFMTDEDGDDAASLASFGQLLDKMHFQGEMVLEMGRYLAAECGYFLTAIVDKKVNHNQNYLIVDGGIHHMNYYGQSMAMKIPHYHQIAFHGRGPAEKWNVCGSLCTVSDIVVKQLPLNDPQVGDVLVFERIGAYSVTEGIYLFLSRDLPKVLFFSNQTGAVLIRDTLATDTINSAE